MRHLGVFPRFLLKQPFAMRLSVAVPCVIFFLLLYMMMPVPARTPSMLAIPMALVAWMFRKRGALICLASMVIVLWIYYAIKMRSILLSPSAIISFIAAILSLVVVGLLVSFQRDVLDLADAAKLQSERAYEQQQQLNRAKDQLILNVNHELRTPLTAVSGYLDLLLTFSEQLDAETRMQFLKIAQENCDDLQVLIGNVLDAFQIDSGKEHFSIRECSVVQVVREVLEHTDPRWQQSHQVSLDISEELAVLANEQNLRQVLRNLLSNAFKYAPAGTEVLISAEPYGDVAQQSASPSQVCINVKDAGPGIPPDELSSLFGQFARLKRDISGSVRGSGLGLYISRQLVEAMEGQIWAESTGIPGQGSCFCFTLPAGLPPSSMNSMVWEESVS
jgi:signal transduction histidine kinase